MSTSQKWWMAAVVLVALGLVGWWFWGGSDLERLQALQSQMRDDSLGEDARRALWQQFREGMRGLSQDEREQLFAGFGGRRGPDLDEFFALPPKQRTAFLDREINKSEQRRRQMQTQGPRGNQGPPGGFGGGPGGFGGGNRSPAEREAAPAPVTRQPRTRPVPAPVRPRPGETPASATTTRPSSPAWITWPREVRSRSSTTRVCSASPPNRTRRTSPMAPDASPRPAASRTAQITTKAIAVIAHSRPVIPGRDPGSHCA